MLSCGARATAAARGEVRKNYAVSSRDAIDNGAPDLPGLNGFDSVGAGNDSDGVSRRPPTVFHPRNRPQIGYVPVHGYVQTTISTFDPQSLTKGSRSIAKVMARSARCLGACGVRRGNQQAGGDGAGKLLGFHVAFLSL